MYFHTDVQQRICRLWRWVYSCAAQGPRLLGVLRHSITICVCIVCTCAFVFMHVYILTQIHIQMFCIHQMFWFCLYVCIDNMYTRTIHMYMVMVLYRLELGCTSKYISALIL